MLSICRVECNIAGGGCIGPEAGEARFYTSRASNGAAGTDAAPNLQLTPCSTRIVAPRTAPTSARQRSPPAARRPRRLRPRGRASARAPPSAAPARSRPQRRRRHRRQELRRPPGQPAAAPAVGRRRDPRRERPGQRTEQGEDVARGRAQTVWRWPRCFQSA